MAQKIPPALIAVAVLVVIAAGIIVLTLVNGQETAKPVLSGTSTHANPAAITTKATTPSSLTSRIANGSRETTIPQSLGSPGSNVSAGTPIEQYPSKSANECIMVPVEGGFVYENNTGFNAGSVENYATPVGMKNPGITIEQAKEFARKAFSNYSPDRVDMEYVDGSENTRGWKFSLYRDNRQLVLGMLSADTGDLMGYSVVSGPVDVPAHPVTTLDDARRVAENEIQMRNGKISLKLTESQVNRDGNYVFAYRRIIHDVPCSKDGISLIVSPGTGSVIRYYKLWYVPENAVAAQTVLAISREAAIALVERESRACYPKSSDGFEILSADPEWKDLYNPDKFTPLPGVIPLTWHVRFDDRAIRSQAFPVPGEGWVDAQNGTLLSLYYTHSQ